MSSDSKQSRTRDPVTDAIRMRRAALDARIAEARRRIGAQATQRAMKLDEREREGGDLSISGERGIAPLGGALPQPEARPSTPPPPPPRARPSMLHGSEPVISAIASTELSIVRSISIAAWSRHRALLVPLLAMATSAGSYWAVSAWASSASAVTRASTGGLKARASNTTQRTSIPPASQPLTVPFAAASAAKPADRSHPHRMPAAIAGSAFTQEIRHAPVATVSVPNMPVAPKLPAKRSSAPFERIAMGSFPTAADGGGASVITQGTKRPALQVIVPVTTTDQPPTTRSALTAHDDEVTIRGSLHGAAVQRALDRILPQLAACEASLDNGGHNETIRVEMLIDVVGRVRNPLVSGASSLPLERCLSTATAKFVSKPPDTGTARVSWRLRFTP